MNVATSSLLDRKTQRQFRGLLVSGDLTDHFGTCKAFAEDASDSLYSDEHFHIQAKTEGPRLPELLRMMDDTCAIPS